MKEPASNLSNEVAIRVPISTPHSASPLGLAFILVLLASCGGGSASPPEITQQPMSQTVNVGQTATFTVSATGAMPLSYQWQKNGANISGATSATYTTPATTTADNGAKFGVTVMHSTQSVASSLATLTVNSPSSPPTITSQPTNQTVVAGQTATFSVVANGTSPLSYQWQKNQVNI